MRMRTDNLADELRWESIAIVLTESDKIPIVKDIVQQALVLAVYAPLEHTINETEKEVLTDLGKSIALAIQRVHSQRSLTAEMVASVGFRIPATQFVFGTVSDELDCELRLNRRVAGQEAKTIYFLEVIDTDPKRVCEELLKSPIITASTVIRKCNETENELLEVHIKSDKHLPIDVLTDYGASIQTARARDGDITLQVELPPEADIRTVLTSLREVAPSIEIVSKQHVKRPTKTAMSIQNDVIALLSEKQRAAMKTAYARGYYSWPRATTVEELSGTFDISPPSMHYRLRKAHDTVISAILDGKQSYTDL